MLVMVLTSIAFIVMHLLVTYVDVKLLTPLWALTIKI